MRPDRPTSTNGPDPLYAIGAADLAGNIAMTDRLLDAPKCTGLHTK